MLFARNGDPVTSHKSMQKLKIGKAVEIAIELHKQNAKLADFEFRPLFEASYTKAHSHHLYRQARSVARDLGKIRDSGETKLNPETNREQVVWEFFDGEPVEVPCCPTCGKVIRNQEENDEF